MIKTNNQWTLHTLNWRKLIDLTKRIFINNSPHFKSLFKWTPMYCLDNSLILMMPLYMINGNNTEKIKQAINIQNIALVLKSISYSFNSLKKSQTRLKQYLKFKLPNQQLTITLKKANIMPTQLTQRFKPFTIRKPLSFLPGQCLTLMPWLGSV